MLQGFAVYRQSCYYSRMKSLGVETPEWYFMAAHILWVLDNGLNKVFATKWQVISAQGIALVGDSKQFKRPERAVKQIQI